ncbi:hypothetical protein D3C80_1715400 [compost metagenome]
MVHTFIGFALKVVFSVALAPFLGVYGLIIGSSICFVTIAWLNLRSINGVVKLNVLGNRWLPYLAAIVLPALSGWGTEYLVLRFTESWADKLSYLAAASATGMVVGGLYVILLAALRVITPDDIRSFPGPIRKVMMLVLKPFFKKAV